MATLIIDGEVYEVTDDELRLYEELRQVHPDFRALQIATESYQDMFIVEDDESEGG